MGTNTLSGYPAVTSLAAADTMPAIVSGALKVIAKTYLGRALARLFGYNFPIGLVANNSTAAAANVTAINAMLSGGGVCCIPPGGNYYINATLAIPSDTTLRAHGATITLANGSNTSMIRNSDTQNGNSNITIIGGTWDANWVNNQSLAANATTGWMGSNLDMYRVSNLGIGQTNVVNGGVHYIMDIRGGSNQWIHDNTALAAHSDYIHFSPTCDSGTAQNYTSINRNVVVERNHITGGGDDPIVWTIGDYDILAIGMAASAENITIRDNICDGAGIVKFFVIRPSVQDGISNGSNAGTNPFFFRNVLIENNYINNLYGSPGITVGSLSVNGHTEANVIQNCIIRNNTIVISGTAHGTSRGLVELQWWGDTCDVKVENVVVSATENYAVRLIAPFVSAGGNVTIDGIRAKNGVTPAQSMVVVDGGGVLNTLTVRDVKYTGVNGEYVLNNKGITVNKIILEDCRVEGQGLLWHNPTSAASVVSNTSSAFITVANCSNLNSHGIASPLRADSRSTWSLMGLSLTNTDQYFTLNCGTDTVTLTGAGVVYNDALNSCQRVVVLAGKIRIRNPDAAFASDDFASLVGVIGDVFRGSTTNGTLTGAPWMFNGSAWKTTAPP